MKEAKELLKQWEVMTGIKWLGVWRKKLIERIIADEENDLNPIEVLVKMTQQAKNTPALEGDLFKYIK